jgi:DNA-directed RNA polymerase specialized sigma24 family protein
LVKEDGLRYKEVAELLQLSVKTVEAQMAIALRRLGKCMHLEIKELNIITPAAKKS